jgi:hypothetical protein
MYCTLDFNSGCIAHWIYCTLDFNSKFIIRFLSMTKRPLETIESELKHAEENFKRLKEELESHKEYIERERHRKVDIFWNYVVRMLKLSKKQIKKLQPIKLILDERLMQVPKVSIYTESGYDECHQDIEILYTWLAKPKLYEMVYRTTTRKGRKSEDFYTISSSDLDIQPARCHELVKMIKRYINEKGENFPLNEQDEVCLPYVLIRMVSLPVQDQLFEKYLEWADDECNEDLLVQYDGNDI